MLAALAGASNRLCLSNALKVAVDGEAIELREGPRRIERLSRSHGEIFRRK